MTRARMTSHRLACTAAVCFLAIIAPAAAVDVTGQIELDATFNQDAADDSWEDRHHITVGPAWSWGRPGLRVSAVLSSEFEGAPGLEAGFTFRPAKSVELYGAAGIARFEHCEQVVTSAGKHLMAWGDPPPPTVTTECEDETRPLYRAGAYFDLFEADATTFVLGAGVRLLDQDPPGADLSPWISVGWRGR